MMWQCLAFKNASNSQVSPHLLWDNKVLFQLWCLTSHYCIPVYKYIHITLKSVVKKITTSSLLSMRSIDTFFCTSSSMEAKGVLGFTHFTRVCFEQCPLINLYRLVLYLSLEKCFHYKQFLQRFMFSLIQLEYKQFIMPSTNHLH